MRQEWGLEAPQFFRRKRLECLPSYVGACVIDLANCFVRLRAPAERIGEGAAQKVECLRVDAAGIPNARHGLGDIHET